MQVETVVNFRDDFGNRWPFKCSYCNSSPEVLLVLPMPRKQDNLYVCKGCLEKGIKIVNKRILSQS
jgi:hypothetical protein